jgi:hypothetical protein
MPRHLRTLLAALAVIGMLAAPATSAFAASGVEMIENEKAHPIVDLLLMRPLGLVGLTVSAVVWVPAELATMAIRWDDRHKPVEYMLKGPARFVFVDRLGEH